MESIILELEFDLFVVIINSMNSSKSLDMIKTVVIVWYT